MGYEGILEGCMNLGAGYLRCCLHWSFKRLRIKQVCDVSKFFLVSFTPILAAN